MTPLRVVVTDQPDGSRLVTVACPCAKLTRRLTGWEPIMVAATDLLELHRKQAPACKHPAIGSLTSPRP